MNEVTSPAFDAVVAAEHPSPEDGGPCATCAFRPGTEANGSGHTVALARLCVEGLTPFNCHEKAGLCRGFVAAVNLKGVPQNEDEMRWQEVAADAADVLGTLIDNARQAQERQP